MSEPRPRLSTAIRELLESVLVAAPDGLSTDELRELAKWLIARAERRDAASAIEGSRASDEPAVDADESSRTAARTAVRRLMIGGKELVLEVPEVEGVAAGAALPPTGPSDLVTAPAARRDDDRAHVAPPLGSPHVEAFDWSRALSLAAERLELKAEACRLVVEVGRPGTSASEEDRARSRRILERARSVEGCWIWSLDPQFDLPDDWQVDLCARAYENLATCVRILTAMPGWVSIDSSPPRELLQDAAEAQSALRAALLDIDLRDDVDQFTVFSWVREQARENRVYIERHMRVDDPADPGRWGDLAERLVRWREHVEAERHKDLAAREEHRLLGKLRFEAGKIGSSTSESERCERWSTVVRVLDEWIAGGRPPSNADLCEVLEDLIEDLPPEVETTDATDLVLRAVAERAERIRERSDTLVATATRRAGPRTREARALLAGRVMVMIGGERRANEEERLREDLGLRELRWIGTRAHRSTEPLVEQILRPEVDVVVMLVRFSDHAFGDLRAVAEGAGKVWVRARGGYGSERIAHEILEQASGKLGGSAPR